tara:strand:+ start:1212 stop:1565 length:354 start_codon:yes stop_codon:yes gene_type:complete
MGLFSFFRRKKEAGKYDIPPIIEETPSGGRWGSPSEGELPDTGLPLGSRREEMGEYEIPNITQQTGIVAGERYEETISPKDIELILSKLDLINSRLDNLNKRFETLEVGRKAAKDLW